MQFGNPILGGSGSLVRQSIHSPDYVAGVSGWTINKDGTAEFNATTIRGDLKVVGANGSQVWIHEVASSAIIEVYPPSSVPNVVPGSLVGSLPFPDTPTIEVVGPTFNNVVENANASIQLRKNPTTLEATIDVSADRINVSTASPSYDGQIYVDPRYTIFERTDAAILTAGEIRSNPTNPFSLTEQWSGLKSGKFYEANSAGAAVTTGSYYSDTNVNVTSTSYIADPAFPQDGFVFNYPASGKVLISWVSLAVHSTTGASIMSWEIRSGSTIGSGTILFAAADARSAEHAGGFETISSFYEATLPGNSASVFNIRPMYRTNTPTATFSRKRLRVAPVLY